MANLMAMIYLKKKKGETMSTTATLIILGSVIAILYRAVWYLEKQAKGKNKNDI